MSKKTKKQEQGEYIFRLENGEEFMLWRIFRCLEKQVGWSRCQFQEFIICLQINGEIMRSREQTSASDHINVREAISESLTLFS